MKHKILLSMPFNELLDKPRSNATGRYLKVDGRLRSGIYAIRNLVNGKVYVGSATNIFHRRRVHFTRVLKNLHHNRYFQAAINKHGTAKFYFEVLEWVADKENLIIREQFWIDKLLACDRQKGYNFGCARGSQLGSKRSRRQKEQHKKVAIRNWRLGIFHRKASAITRQRLSASHIGHKRTIESRIKQGQTLRRKYGTSVKRCK